MKTGTPRPIDGKMIFSEDSVRAILGGQKTQTRRVLRFPSLDVLGYAPETGRVDRGPSPAGNPGPYLHCQVWHKDDGRPTDEGFERSDRVYPGHFTGDVILVRETCWIAPPNFAERDGTEIIDDQGRPRVVGYQADMGDCAVQVCVKKTSPLFMPDWAARLFLKITEVRVQRLNAITDDDALAEGVRDGQIDPDGTWAKACGSFYHHPDDLSMSVRLLHLWDDMHAKPKAHTKKVKGKSVTTHYEAYPSSWSAFAIRCGAQLSKHNPGRQFRRDTNLLNDRELREELLWNGKPLVVMPNPWVAAYSFEVAK